MSTGPQGTLWLHVGTHKTGTTSIQHALQAKSSELQAAGIATYPEPNAWRLANALLRPELQTTPRMVLGHPLADLATLLGVRDLVAEARAGKPDMIISSEEFCLMRTSLEAFAVKAILAADFARVVPIIVLRNQTDWRRSREDQLRKAGTWDRLLALPDEVSTNGSWYYDTSAIRSQWSGVGPCRVIDYDQACQKHGDILPAFAEAIGLPRILDGLSFRLNARQAAE